MTDYLLLSNGMSDYIPNQLDYTSMTPTLKVDEKTPLSLREKWCIIRWHFNEGMSIWSKNPVVVTCISLVKRRCFQSMCNIVSDFKAHGFVRCRLSHRKMCRKGSFLDEHYWDALKWIVINEPHSFLNELTNELNSTCDTTHKEGVVENVLLAQKLTWKKIERVAS